MSATPRTDAVVWRLPEGYNPREHVPADFARGLELELGVASLAANATDPLWKRIRMLERFVILETMKKHQDNRSAAARELGIARETLRRKLKATSKAA